MEDTSNYRNIKETYKIEATLGKGSFATVKKAKNRATGERFAVKVVSKKKMTDEDKASLQTEIEILKSLDHPNIVNLIDVFEDERHWCLVMELMQGGELFDQILEKEHFTELEAREATKAIIDAIQYCHEKGICHRDIKPENLLLQSKELGITSLKVADFGLARLLEENTLASTTCGTPGYVAPEVLMQKPYGKSCDIWSIGVVGFILLSGTPPFYEEDNFALFEQIK
jgi:calcium/calmodulin-dependent protein kinase I